MWRCCSAMESCFSLHIILSLSATCTSLNFPISQLQDLAMSLPRACSYMPAHTQQTQQTCAVCLMTASAGFAPVCIRRYCTTERPHRPAAMCNGSCNACTHQPQHVKAVCILLHCTSSVKTGTKLCSVLNKDTDTAFGSHIAHEPACNFEHSVRM